MGADASCQILLNYTGSKTQILDNNSEGPFDSDDDTLVGIVNNSSKTLNSIALASGSPIFGFDGDGLCAGYDPGPAGCSFGDTGYEGPGVTFSGINASATAGVLTFKSGLPPGATTYFSLEEALDADTVFAGGPSSAEQGGGVPSFEPSTTCYAKLPVNCATGAFTHTFEDISIPGRSVALAVDRSYTSSLAAEDGAFGHGWTFSYGQRLETSAEDGAVTYVDDTGARVKFTLRADGTYKTAPWVQLGLAKNDDGSFSLTKLPSQLALAFSENGNLVGETDRNGYQTHLTYNGSGQLAAVIDPAGRQLTFTWTGTHVTGLIDPMQRSHRYSYDASGNLAQVVDALGDAWTFSYDSQNLLTKLSDPTGHSIDNTYDADGRVTKQTDLAGLSTHWTYDGDPSSTAGSTTTMIDEHLDTTIYTYANFELQSVTHAAGTKEAELTSYSYDPATLRRSTVTDPLGNVTSNLFDTVGNLTATTDPLGRTTYYSYDTFGNVSGVLLPSGATTRYNDDGRGNLVSVVDALGNLTSYSHDDADHPGDVTTETDADSRQLLFAYDSYGNVTSKTTSPEAGAEDIADFGYDADGEQVCAASPVATGSGHTCPAAGSSNVAETTRSSYDADGRLTSVVDPQQHQSTVEYDKAGNQTARTDPKGSRLSTTYDPNGRVTSTITADDTPAAEKTSYSYDIQLGSGGCTDGVASTASYCATKSDGNGHITTTFFDSADHVVAVVRPGNKATVIERDADGHEIAETKPSGTVISKTYDTAGQLLDVTSGGDTLTRFSYDADGHRSQMDDESGTTIYERDALGRATKVTDGAGKSISYHYDETGRLIQLGYPSGDVVSRSFDGAGRLVSITDWLGHKTSYGYTADNKIAEVDYPNGVINKRTYNADGALADTTLDQATNHLAQISYVRDSDNEITQEIDGGGLNASRSFSYDAHNRVTADGAQAFGYDAADNLINRGGVSQSFDEADELTASATGSPLALSYDGDGRRTSEASDEAKTTYQYDVLGRLTGLTSSNRPKVTHLSPTSGPASGGTAVTVTGSDFTPDATVSFGRTAAQATTVSSTSSLTTIAPPGSGAVDVTVTTSAGTSVVAADARYTYLTPPPSGPSITSLSPMAGPKAGKTSVTINGAGLTGATSVKFGKGVAKFKVISDSKITATAPKGSGTVDVRVTVKQLLSSITSSDRYTYFAAPTVKKLQPTAGPTSGGTVVAITGKNLKQVSVVSFGSKNASFSFSAAGAITAKAPASAKGVVDVRVRTPGGLSAKSKADRYAYVSSTARLRQSSAGRAAAITGLSLTFTYNGDGVRTARTDTDGTAHPFTYDTTQATPLLLDDGQAEYVYGPDGLPLAQVDQNGTQYFFADSIGSTRALLDDAGKLTATYSYTTFGSAVKIGGGSTALQFAAAYVDPLRGLSYLVNRYYDSATGQFLTVDPLLAVTGDAYSYAGNDPVDGIDPLGLSWYNPLSWSGSTWAAVGVGVALVAVGVATFGVGDLVVGSVAVTAEATIETTSVIATEEAVVVTSESLTVAASAEASLTLGEAVEGVSTAVRVGGTLRAGVDTYRACSQHGVVSSQCAESGIGAALSLGEPFIAKNPFSDLAYNALQYAYNKRIEDLEGEDSDC